MNGINMQDDDGFNLEPIAKLSKDLKAAARKMSRNEVRYLVDLYYQIQEFRKQLGNQVRGMEEAHEPHAMHEYFFNQIKQIETNIKAAMQAFASEDFMGSWSMSINGIGAVLAAGLTSFIDMDKCPTVGHIHSFAGLHPLQRWYSAAEAKEIVNDHFDGKESDIIPTPIIAELGELTGKNLFRLLRNKSLANLLDNKDPEIEEFKPSKKNIIRLISLRPHCAKLKVLCWKIGQSFVKASHSEKDFYGKLYYERKAYEQQQNEAGAYKDQAEEGAKRVGKTTDAYEWYSKGMLPPGHIDARARRWTVKLFLSHWWYMAYVHKYGKEPVLPYAIAHLNHIHMIDPPNKAV